MTGLSNYACSAVLDWATGQVPMPTITNAQVALFLTVGQDNGAGFVEVSGNAYARAQTTPLFWGPPTVTKPIQIVNIRAISFPVAASNWGTVIGFGLYDLNGNLLFADYLGAGQWQPFTAAIGANGIFTSPGHGLAVGSKLVLSAGFGGALPLATTSLAGVLTVGSVINVDTFTVGASVTTSGDGMLRQVLPLTISLNQTASFNPAALVLQLS